MPPPASRRSSEDHDRDLHPKRGHLRGRQQGPGTSNDGDSSSSDDEGRRRGDGADEEGGSSSESCSSSSSYDDDGSSHSSSANSRDEMDDDETDHSDGSSYGEFGDDAIISFVLSNPKHQLGHYRDKHLTSNERSVGPQHGDLNYHPRDGDCDSEDSSIAESVEILSPSPSWEQKSIASMGRESSTGQQQALAARDPEKERMMKMISVLQEETRLLDRKLREREVVGSIAKGGSEAGAPGRRMNMERQHSVDDTKRATGPETGLQREGTSAPIEDGISGETRLKNLPQRQVDPPHSDSHFRSSTHSGQWPTRTSKAAIVDPEMPRKMRELADKIRDLGIDPQECGIGPTTWNDMENEYIDVIGQDILNSAEKPDPILREIVTLEALEAQIAESQMLAVKSSLNRSVRPDHGGRLIVQEAGQVRPKHHGELQIFQDSNNSGKSMRTINVGLSIDSSSSGRYTSPESTMAGIPHLLLDGSQNASGRFGSTNHRSIELKTEKSPDPPQTSTGPSAGEAKGRDPIPLSLPSRVPRPSAIDPPTAETCTGTSADENTELIQPSGGLQTLHETKSYANLEEAGMAHNSETGCPPMRALSLAIPSSESYTEGFMLPPSNERNHDPSLSSPCTSNSSISSRIPTPPAKEEKPKAAHTSNCYPSCNDLIDTAADSNAIEDEQRLDEPGKPAECIQHLQHPTLLNDSPRNSPFSQSFDEQIDMVSPLPSKQDEVNNVSRPTKNSINKNENLWSGSNLSSSMASKLAESVPSPYLRPEHAAIESSVQYHDRDYDSGWHHSSNELPAHHGSHHRLDPAHHDVKSYASCLDVVVDERENADSYTMHKQKPTNDQQHSPLMMIVETDTTTLEDECRTTKEISLKTRKLKKGNKPSSKEKSKKLATSDGIGSSGKGGTDAQYPDHLSAAETPGKETTKKKSPASKKDALAVLSSRKREKEEALKALLKKSSTMSSSCHLPLKTSPNKLKDKITESLHNHRSQLRKTKSCHSVSQKKEKSRKSMSDKRSEELSRKGVEKDLSTTRSTKSSSLSLLDGDSSFGDSSSSDSSSSMSERKRTAVKGKKRNATSLTKSKSARVLGSKMQVDGKGGKEVGRKTLNRKLSRSTSLKIGSEKGTGSTIAPHHTSNGYSKRQTKGDGTQISTFHHPKGPSRKSTSKSSIVRKPSMRSLSNHYHDEDDDGTLDSFDDDRSEITGNDTTEHLPTTHDKKRKSQKKTKKKKKKKKKETKTSKERSKKEKKPSHEFTITIINDDVLGSRSKSRKK
jgi:hypothetical protein